MVTYHSCDYNHSVWIKCTISFPVETLITHIIKVYLINRFQHGSSNPVRDSSLLSYKGGFFKNLEFAARMNVKVVCSIPHRAGWSISQSKTEIWLGNIEWNLENRSRVNRITCITSTRSCTKAWFSFFKRKQDLLETCFMKAVKYWFALTFLPLEVFT